MAERDAACDPAHLTTELIVVESVCGDLRDDECDEEETQNHCEADDCAEVEGQAGEELEPLTKPTDQSWAVGTQNRRF